MGYAHLNIWVLLVTFNIYEYDDAAFLFGTKFESWYRNIAFVTQKFTPRDFV